MDIPNRCCAATISCAGSRYRLANTKSNSALLHLSTYSTSASQLSCSDWDWPGFWFFQEPKTIESLRRKIYQEEHNPMKQSLRLFSFVCSLLLCSIPAAQADKIFVTS